MPQTPVAKRVSGVFLGQGYCMIPPKVESKSAKGFQQNLQFSFGARMVATVATSVKLQLCDGG